MVFVLKLPVSTLIVVDCCLRLPAVDPAMSNSLKIFLKPEDLIHLRIPMVFLKQFRDGVEPDRACFQAVQECNTTLTRFHDARVYFHRYEVEIGEFASHPIRSDFGFPAGPLKVDVAFWVKFDFNLEVCTEVEKCSD